MRKARRPDEARPRDPPQGQGRRRGGELGGALRRRWQLLPGATPVPRAVRPLVQHRRASGGVQHVRSGVDRRRGGRPHGRDPGPLHPLHLRLRQVHQPGHRYWSGGGRVCHCAGTCAAGTGRHRRQDGRGHLRLHLEVQAPARRQPPHRVHLRVQRHPPRQGHPLLQGLGRAPHVPRHLRRRHRRAPCRRRRPQGLWPRPVVRAAHPPHPPCCRRRMWRQAVRP
mmetsp:Transcript_52637/g.114237  ORF Transcript_52637/g.114237 Transcript_52637/m.114237 type:complete len:224 (+) Transcript_52637:420-1091(+)